ncbi:protein phosphatase 2C domain-containing protein [Catellatospora tritici]|uniref:protein phosphatase 2C domain-containing protein n=1 Tax=Catellatospora tritici TaxID=2851566 RepID=UPI001C2DB74B|nr:protein phosphatase 2C domain-containing protein [Catellatospora tritici]MBV1850041.1 protein phosphatase 2C domain-containing protein [Catellatospora tritici]
MAGYRAVTPPPQAGWDAAPRIHNQPRPGDWARIVIDTGNDQIEPQPYPAYSVPDTICDGWSTPDFTVRMASCRGDAHRATGQPRQDHAVTTLHPSGALLFAVMDGVSSAPLSHLGAELTGHTVLQALWDAVDVRPPWEEVFQRAADALLSSRQGLRPAESAEHVERRLGTTVVAGVVTATTGGPLARVARIGDSGAWWLRGGSYRSVFDPKGRGAATVDSRVAGLPRVPARVESEEVLLSRGSVLLVATDGIGDPLGDGTGLVGQLFSTALAEPPPLLGFAHLVDFARETFDDDRTLLAIWPGGPR